MATVSISAVFGDSGLIKKAQEAKDMTANAVKAEQEGMNKLLAEYTNIIAEDEEIPTVPEKSEVEEAIENGTKYASTTPIKDEFENTVYVPGGFKLATDSGTSVGEGIVIEDASGNQFVWIPVETYKISASESRTNNLSRRTFTSSGATEVSGDEGISSSSGSNYYYGEGDSRSIASGTIGAFKTSATTKGGFYIGRYEQGTGNVCKAGVEPYVSVTRDTANTQAKAMYNGNSYVTSELISSYAWDTALNFICQTNTEGYTLATTTDETYGNIGASNPTTTGEYEADKYSKICDFLGNRREWTTEYCSYSGYPCVIRGGYYGSSSLYAAYRDRYSTSGFSDTFGFRLQIYVK